MSCASFSYTHSPRENINQVLNHLHVLLLSHFSFQEPYGDLHPTPIRDQNNLPPLAAHPHALFWHCFLPTSLGCRCSLPLPWIRSEAENASQPSQNIWLPVWNVFLPVFVLAGAWGGSLCCLGLHRVTDAPPAPTWKQLFWPSRYILNN